VRPPSTSGTRSAVVALVALPRSREAGDALGLELAQMAEALQSVRPVPGRVQAVDEGQDFAVLVDYSHKPGALETVLASARELADTERTSSAGTGGRVIVVFGAGGDRDRAKRPLMGRVAADLADVTIVTSDNPRSEDPLAIIEDVMQGAGLDVEIDPDRRSAIARAMSLAEDDDVVVIAGKGHETGQEFADRTIPFDDRVVAAEELRSLGVGG
jgi:UDP-N-acetylmuramoyl-L-alanyl-D-glutamate--2,6-diaminopimelate ligase